MVLVVINDRHNVGHNQKCYFKVFLLSGHDLYKCKLGPRLGKRELIRNQIRGAIIINLSFQLRLK